MANLINLICVSRWFYWFIDFFKPFPLIRVLLVKSGSISISNESVCVPAQTAQSALSRRSIGGKKSWFSLQKPLKSASSRDGHDESTDPLTSWWPRKNNNNELRRFFPRQLIFPVQIWQIKTIIFHRGSSGSPRNVRFKMALHWSMFDLFSLL